MMKDVPEYEGLYTVDEMGHVYSRFGVNFSKIIKERRKMANEYILKQDVFDAVEARIDELMTHPEFRRKHLDIDLSGVIRNISAIKPAAVLPYFISSGGTLTITVPKGTYKKINRVLVQEDGTQWGGLFYAD